MTIENPADLSDTDPNSSLTVLGGATNSNGNDAGLVVGETTEQGQIGGERNTSSADNNYDATKHECNSTILNTVITAQPVSGGAPAYLMGITIHTALTGTLTITGLTNVAGAATDWVIPVGAVGSILPAGNARICATALIATLSSASDYGLVMIDWRAK